MSYHATIQRARKPYRCQSEWGHPPEIHPGEEYARVKWFADWNGEGHPSKAMYFHVDCWNSEDEIQLRGREDYL